MARWCPTCGRPKELHEKETNPIAMLLRGTSKWKRPDNVRICPVVKAGPRPTPRHPWRWKSAIKVSTILDPRTGVLPTFLRRDAKA